MNTIAYTPSAVRRQSTRSPHSATHSAMIRIGLVLAFAAICSMWDVWISPAVAKSLVAATRSTSVESGE